MSRKVILYIATSLDGFIADENGNIDWLNSVDIVEEDNSYDSFIKTIDTVILGRKTYDQVTKELAKDSYPYENQISYVMTSKTEKNIDNIIFTNENIIELVNKLKSEKGKDIWIIGGANTIEALVIENLIDEYQICMLPIILGKGIRLFKELEKPLQLKTESVNMVNGMIYSKYTSL